MVSATSLSLECFYEIDVGLFSSGPRIILDFWHMTTRNIYIQITSSRNGRFITFYTFAFPLVLLFVFEWVCPDYEISTIGLILISLIPILSCFWPNSFRPFADIFPHFHVNTTLLAIISIMVGQLLCIVAFEYLPLFPDHATGQYFIERISNNAITQRDYHAIFVMVIAHSAYFVFGFILLCQDSNLPSFPQSPLFMVCLSLWYLIVLSLAISPSKDFFYLTPGYTTYHFPARRFWFHLGGWTWVSTVFLGCKTIVREPFDKTS